jgi:hypothetical protein
MTHNKIQSNEKKGQFSFKYNRMHKLTCLAIGAGVASDTGAGVRVDAINTSGTILAR